MRSRARFLALAALAAPGLVACGDNLQPILEPPMLPTPAPLALAALGVDVAPEASRPFVYTNKVAAYFYGEAAGPHTSGWQGLNVRGFTFVDDWHWTVAGELLGAGRFDTATVYPDHALRRYQGGLEERITLLDQADVLLVEPAGAGPLVLRPLMNDGRSADYYEIRAQGSALLVARKNHMERTSPGDHPVWIAIQAAAGRPR